MRSRQCLSALRAQEQRTLILGQQHDAQEALDEILTQSALSEHLFNVGSPGHRADIVTLPPFAEGGWWFKDFTSHSDMGVTSVDMTRLLQEGFGHLDGKLSTVSPLLAVVIPPFASEEADDTAFWLSGVLQAEWGDRSLDLVNFFHHVMQQSVHKRSTN